MTTYEKPTPAQEEVLRLAKQGIFAPMPHDPDPEGFEAVSSQFKKKIKKKKT